MHASALTLTLTKNLLLTHYIVQPYYQLVCRLVSLLFIAVTEQIASGFGCTVGDVSLNEKTHHTYFPSTSSILPPFHNGLYKFTYIFISIFSPLWTPLSLQNSHVIFLSESFGKIIFVVIAPSQQFHARSSTSVTKINTIVVVVFNKFTTNLYALKLSSLLPIHNWPIQQ